MKISPTYFPLDNTELSPTVAPLAQPPTPSAKKLAPTRRRAQGVQAERAQIPVPTQPSPAQTVQDSAQTDVVEADADFAAELIASGVTTQPAATVIAVLAAIRDGASINAAATASGINYRTAQRIAQAAGQQKLEAVS
jgi:hypothetical protein